MLENTNSMIEQTATIADDDEANITLTGIELSARNSSPIQTKDWTKQGAKPKNVHRVVVDKSLGDLGIQYALPFVEKQCQIIAAPGGGYRSVGASAAATHATKADSNIANDRRTMYIDGLRRMKERMAGANRSILSKHAISLQIENANKYGEKFLDSHNDVYAAASSSVDRRTASDLHFEIESLHSEILAELHERLEECSLNVGASQLAGGYGRTIDVKLPSVSIDPFNGDFEKWPGFKSVFMNYFSQGYTKHAKMISLRQSLIEDSEAYNLIAGLEPNGENFDVAWATLCNTYDDVRRILEKSFCALLDARSVPTPATRAVLLSLVTRTRNIMETMSKYGVNTSTWGPALVPIVARKLDPASHSDWCLARPRKKIPEIEPLLQFITIRSEGIEEYNRALNVNRNAQNNNFRSIPNSNSNNSNHYNNNRNNFRQSNASTASANNASAGGTNQNNAGQQVPGKRKCPDPLCIPNNKHHLYTCPRFRSLSIEQRTSKASVLGVCVCCLSKGCEPQKCKLNGCTACGEKHNSWLCTASPRAPFIPSQIQQAPAVHLAACVPHDADTIVDSAQSTLLATAVIVIVDKCGNPIEFRALCDPGSQVNLITASAHQKLRFGRTVQPVDLTGIDGNKSVGVGKVHLKFQSRFSSANQHHMTAIILKRITSRLPSNSLETSNYHHIEGLSLADPQFNVTGDIDILLGAAVCSELIKSGIKRGDIGQPIAQCTRIGWIIYGNTRVPQCKLAALHAIAETSESVDDIRLDELLQRLWEVECVPQKHLRTKEEQLCEDHFVTNTVRNENGRYVVKLPIKAESFELGNSRQMALRRLMQLEQRFERMPLLKENYVQFMREYLELGHMQEAGPLPHGKQHYYIPHHAAGTKKFRVVFDGSSKTSNGKSLNDIQLTGEKLQPSLTATTMRFRTNKVAMTADVKKMYRQVLVSQEQLDYQRILWRENSKLPIKEFQLTTQTYGLRSAPHNCVRALIQCATDYQQEYPVAAEVAKRDLYVDDLLTSAHTIDDAVKLYHDLNEMLPKAGFELAKWTTNSMYMHSQVGEIGPSKPVKFESSEEGENSVLGLRWSSREDAFKYKIAMPNPGEKITKRRIVSHAAKLYDPNGYLSPVTVVPKILIQEIWATGAAWDTKFADNIARNWKKFLDDLPQLKKVKIPRWLGTGGKARVKLHGFCDASNDAYACAFYIKSVDELGTIRVNLVMSRTRVAPLKRSTTPRLELCGAHLLAKLLDDVKSVHGVQTENTFLWTDSMIVLHWLNKEPARVKVYVANRVAETEELTKGCVWQHVPTAENPADMASRRISPSEIADCDLWWHGPRWLMQEQDSWPKSKIVLTAANVEAMAAEESKPVALALTEATPLAVGLTALLESCRSIDRMYRVTAWILRFVRNCKRDASEREKGPLTMDEFLTAANRWLKAQQKRHFSKEIDCCEADPRSKVKLPKESTLIGLRPFIDGEGILRCSGRLENATIPFDASHSILLQPECALAKFIIRCAHRATLHGGTQTTMQYVRNKFWIPRLRTATKMAIRRCPICKRYNADPMHQLMGWLPRARVTPGRPFKETGVDYCGPFNVKARGGRCKIITKGYMAVFVCMKTRAVHLELVSEMTSEAFLAALSRMSSRRGRVHDLYSDNGTNFLGAEKELIAAVKSWKKLAHDDMVQDTWTKWHFIPPGSPHHGGLWEAAVKSAKYHLRRVVGTQQLTFEEMSTVLSQVEACLNSRPICSLSDDNTDKCPLTPAHFLVGEPIVAPMTRDWTTTPENRLKRWKLLERFSQDFWKRWRNEYLDQLLSRSKWKEEERNAELNDRVLVRADNVPPTQWPIGRIIHTYPGADGLVRSVDVKCDGKVYRRPITKLVPLPTDPES